ncbi:hypothetical protein BaRGS_00002629, partial [Batillaria attramentaria]
ILSDIKTVWVGIIPVNMAQFKGVPVCHILAVILGSLEIVLFGGVIFGWHSVVYIYKDVGYFEGGCETPKQSSHGDEQFNLIFSLATGINGMLSFPSGILYDRLGTRISRIVSLVCFMGGQLFLIFASREMPGLLYPGFIGIVYGGYQILLTNLQYGGLIPNLRSTIMSLYSGSYDTSSAIFLLFKAAYEGGVSINTSFAIQASLYFVIFTSSTFFLLPRTKIPNPLPPDFRLRSYLCQKFCKDEEPSEPFSSHEWKVDPNGSIVLVQGEGDASSDPVDRMSGTSESGTVRNLDEAETQVGEEQTLPQNGSSASRSNTEKSGTAVPETIVDEGKASRDPDAPDQESEAMIQSVTSPESRKTFRQVALSPLFLTDLMWMSFQRLRSWIFVGMFNPWITRLACGDKTLVSHYTSVYAGLQFFGILTAPLSGRLMDRKIKGAEKYGDPRYERLHASIASFVLNSSVSVILTIGTLIPVLEVQYATFVLHCLHRSFLYGPNSAFVANAFPNEHFGKLFGVTLTVSALFSCVQYPLFLIMQGPLKGDPRYINVFLLILMVISFIHPIYIWRYLQKKVAARNR